MQQREKKQAIEAHWRSLKGAPIVDVPWASCQKTMHVGGGTGGCLLAELEGGAAICIKPQKIHAVSEFVAERVLKALGIPVASCRPVSWTSEEYQTLAASVLSAPVMIEGQEASVKNLVTGVSSSDDKGNADAIDVEFLGILEFVPGHGLIGLEAHNALADAGAMEIYKALGRICAADAIINNLDRVPLPIWGNDGNLSNVMIKKSGEVVAIDQQINIIVEGPGREAYLSKLKDLVSDSKSGANSKAAGCIKQALMENTGTDPSVEALDAMIAELRSSFEHAARLWTSGAFEEAISSALFEAMLCFDTAGKDVGQTRVEAMGDFVRRTAAVVAEAIGDA